MNRAMSTSEIIKLAAFITFVACYAKFVMIDKPARDQETLRLTKIERGVES
jgi:hypothetical protein